MHNPSPNFAPKCGTLFSQESWPILKSAAHSKYREFIFRVAVFLIIRCIEASQLKSYLQKVWNDLEKPRRRSARCEVIAPCLPPRLFLKNLFWVKWILNDEFSDWNKEVIPNSQMEKSMAEVAVVNALILRQGYSW